MERAFVDTSAWIAFVDRDAGEHEAVRKTISMLQGRIVTSNFVFDETATHCRRDLGHRVAVACGERLRGRLVDLVRVTAQDEDAAWMLFVERGDKEYSFTDCTSFVLMRRLGIFRAIALDQDFAREGFEVLPGR